MSKIDFSIKANTLGAGNYLRDATLVPRNYIKYQSLLSDTETFDTTNVRGRVKLNDINFYNYRDYYKDFKKRKGDNTPFAYSHQIQTVEAILGIQNKQNGGLIADQVGMGKTIEAGMLIAEMAYRDDWRTLIITTTNTELLNNWQREMKSKFGLTLAVVSEKAQLKPKDIFDNLVDYYEKGVVKDDKGSAAMMYEDAMGNVIGYDQYKGLIISFNYLENQELLDMISDYNKKHTNPLCIELIVVDEAHKYTHDDKSAEHLTKLHYLQGKKEKVENGKTVIEKQGKILLVTATPIKTDVRELMDLMRVIDPNISDEEMKESLNLPKTDTSFSLTSIIEQKDGARYWWQWFSKFGERHTRQTTLYNEKTNKYGVHWKKKSSYSYYFNNDLLCPVRPYFTAIDDNITIQTVTGKTVERETGESKELRGERKSEVISYTSEIAGFNMEKFNKLIQIVDYIKGEISDEYFRNIDFSILGETSQKTTAFDFVMKKNKDKPMPRFGAPYSSFGTEKEEIQKKEKIENYLNDFLTDFFALFQKEDFHTDIIKKYLINRFNGALSKDIHGNYNIDNFSAFAYLFCSKKTFLQIEKMVKLSEIIRMHPRDKIIIFCKDDGERRMLINFKCFWDADNRFADIDLSETTQMLDDDINKGKYINKVFIAYKEDGEGLNYQSFHIMVHYSIIVSPLQMEQRIGRIDRIGQEYDMSIYFLANAQDAEGYALRFFEYELELFNNWNGDTTASTYVDESKSGKKMVRPFEESLVEHWKNHMTEDNVSVMGFESSIGDYEKTLERIYADIRKRVYAITRACNDLDDNQARADVMAIAEADEVLGVE